MGSTFELVDWVKGIALPNVGGPHPTNLRPDKNKKVEEEGFPPAWLCELRFWFFPVFRPSQKHQLFLGLEPASFHTGIHAISSPGFPACWLQILGLGLHDYMSQFFIIKPYIWFSLENPNTRTKLLSMAKMPYKTWPYLPSHCNTYHHAHFLYTPASLVFFHFLTHTMLPLSWGFHLLIHWQTQLITEFLLWVKDCGGMGNITWTWQQSAWFHGEYILVMGGKQHMNK